jgi:pyruvate formate lyase activating enzyme
MLVQGKPKIIGRDVTVEEVLEEVKKDLPYYRRSGGGITLSGGEALCQPEFGSALLQACQEYNINTAMESTGFGDFNVIEQYLPYLDLYLMDIKHIDSKKHQEYTGRPNETILANARKIAESGVPLIIRVPVIPGFNHTHEEIKAIAAFAKTLPGVTELHLLPYHRLGMDKYEGLGREYTLSHIEPLDGSYMEQLLKTVEATGLACQLGG